MTLVHRLTLLRHAKSDWNGPAGDDRDRTLAPRGSADARAVGRRFAEDGLSISLVLCSPATRTRQTWDGVREGVAGVATVSFVEEIYQAGVGALLALLRGLDDATGDVLLIGHNPGVSDLSLALAGDGERWALDRLAEKFSPAAFATLRTDVAWRELDRGCARLEAFVRASELRG